MSDKITFNASDIAQLLGISRSAAYELMHREDFPTITIGKRMVVLQNQFYEWINQQSKNTPVK
ncbi:helix-turn-helix transcriptional regulator [Agathobaculum sp. Marseille-P7918]|uniref:helix-turn-helix transcriptional regulator n=1 Tax=Agathobaculum sp. Marseille-P7918 TaxID=2479843 RepID=UPI003567E8B2